mmetsp:Transcript_73691/g.144629  ORF Transcript_73691/g.144629 Transcript_73691/m.144629 type:complete len:218 (+) Transcript_73691:63-716(+)
MIVFPGIRRAAGSTDKPSGGRRGNILHIRRRLSRRSPGELCSGRRAGESGRTAKPHAACRRAVCDLAEDAGNVLVSHRLDAIQALWSWKATPDDLRPTFEGSKRRQHRALLRTAASSVSENLLGRNVRPTSCGITPVVAARGWPIGGANGQFRDESLPNQAEDLTLHMVRHVTSALLNASIEALPHLVIQVSPGSSAVPVDEPMQQHRGEHQLVQRI